MLLSSPPCRPPSNTLVRKGGPPARPPRTGPAVYAAAGAFAAAAAAALQRRGPKLAPSSQDPIFRWLSKVLGKEDLGQVLDAGTGPDSLSWLSRQELRSITAVTACDGMYATLEEEVLDFLHPSRDKVLLGNWKDEHFLRGRSFDVVLADYLLGSVDFFAPYFQVGLLKRLTQSTKLGGLLILLGKEPQEETCEDPTSQLVLDVECFRDAVMMLGRQRPYREMPRRWCAEQLGQDFELVKGRLFPRRLTVDKVMRNLDWAEEELHKVPAAQLRDDLRRQLEVLRQQVSCAPLEGHVFGQDYALVLKRKLPG